MAPLYLAVSCLVYLSLVEYMTIGLFSEWLLEYASYSVLRTARQWMHVHTSVHGGFWECSQFLRVHVESGC